jgi:8-hydroxy-5-deazaflavin:NADPH oxidoreductase
VRWADDTGVGLASFAAAAAEADLAVNATAGSASVGVLRGAADGLSGKVLVDVANPLDFSSGFPPCLTVVNTESLAEQIQAALPETRVVKALNTMTAAVMVEPGRLAGPHHLPLAGNDGRAKADVATLLGDLGWPDESILDLGELAAARGMEAYLLLWVRLMGALDTPMFNVRIVREE